MALSEAIGRRRSVRQYAARALRPEEIGQLLWAAQGITGNAYLLRAAPSAGALYPLELYVADAQGTFHYRPKAHELLRVGATDVRAQLRHAAFDQMCVEAAACVIAVAADPRRTTRKYGERGMRYVLMEAGHAAENVLLQAAALGLGAVPVGAFDDVEAARVLGLPRGDQALYLLPVGAV